MPADLPLLYGVRDQLVQVFLNLVLNAIDATARGGRIVVTVPCGEEEDHGWFVQREPDSWNGLFLDAGLRVEEQEIYALGTAGWQAAPDFDPRGVRYGERGAAAVLCATVGPAGGPRLLVRRARAAARPRAGGAAGSRRAREAR